jgi:hypothetical protein
VQRVEAQASVATREQARGLVALEEGRGGEFANRPAMADGRRAATRGGREMDGV